MRAVQGHSHHLDLWMNTAVWSRTVSQVVLTCMVHLPCWSNLQTWGDEQGVRFGTDPWCCSERRNVRHRASVWRRGFQQCYREGKQQHANGFFLGCDKCNFCHKKYGMFWCGCKFWERRKVLHSALLLTPVSHNLWPKCIEMCKPLRKTQRSFSLKAQPWALNEASVPYSPIKAMESTMGRKVLEYTLWFFMCSTRFWKGWDALCQAFGMDRHSSLALCSLKQLLARLLRCQQARHKDCQGTAQNPSRDSWVLE